MVLFKKQEGRRYRAATRLEQSLSQHGLAAVAAEVQQGRVTAGVAADSFLFVELHGLGPSVKPRKPYNAFKKA